MREVFPKLFGNDATKTALAASIASGRLPHALIITGPKGSGKRLLCDSVAAALLCENRARSAYPLPCGRCAACRKTAEGLSPDITYVEPEEGKSTVTVDKIRAIRTDMHLAANDSDSKIYVIENADAMNAAAQNALLISLEEPPEGVYVFLLCDSPESLLPTVRSRCQTVRMQLFEPEEMDAFLKNEPGVAPIREASEERYRLMLEAAHGRIGEARRLLSASALGETIRERELCDRVVAAVGGHSFSALYTALAALPTEKRNEFAEILQMLSEAVRDLILLKRSPTVALLYYTDRAAALAVSENIGLRRLLTLEDAIESAISDLERNANITLLLQGISDAIRK